MKSVRSSTIDSVGYDEPTKTMKVKFKSGGTYSYAGVPKDEHDRLVTASSVGSHFHKHIKSKYKGTK